MSFDTQRSGDYQPTDSYMIANFLLIVFLIAFGVSAFWHFPYAVYVVAILALLTALAMIAKK